MKILPATNKINQKNIDNRYVLWIWNDHLVVKSKIKGKVIKVLHQNSPIILQNLSLSKKISNLRYINSWIKHNFPELYLNTRLFITQNWYLILQDEIKWEELNSNNIWKIHNKNIIKLIELILFFDWDIDLFGIWWYYAFKNLWDPIMSNVFLLDNWELKIIDYDKMYWKHSEKSKYINIYIIILLLFPGLNKNMLKKVIENSDNPSIFLYLILNKIWN